MDYAHPTSYRQSGPEIAQVTSRLESLQAELAEVYTRWEALEELAE